jgi:hypothetical protein
MDDKEERGQWGVLKFPLPEERDGFKLACQAQDWHSVAWDMAQYLREKLKYGHEFKSANDALEQTQDKLFEFLNDHGLSIYD